MRIIAAERNHIFGKEVAWLADADISITSARFRSCQPDHATCDVNHVGAGLAFHENLFAGHIYAPAREGRKSSCRIVAQPVKEVRL